VALRKSNVPFSFTRLEKLVAAEFTKIATEVWARYDDHAIGVEDYYVEASRRRWRTALTRRSSSWRRPRETG